MTNRPRLSYANVVSTLALFLALGGSAALAADKLHSGDIAPGAVHTSNIFKRAIVSGKLALGAVRSNQIADGAVGSQQIGSGAVGSRQIADGAVSSKQIEDSTIGSKQVGSGAIAPANLQFPVFYAASPRSGSVPVTAGPDSLPLDESAWTQNPGEIEVVFGGATATLAYDGSGSGSCRVFFEVNLNGQQVGGGEISTESTTPAQIEQNIGAQPQIDPTRPTTNHLAVRTGSNGDCTPDSTIDSTRFRVLDFG
ncbi:MAG TPA: hypothetical protein VLK56_01260 [Solirubrobacterales bacterium]|nr:hypothetical protein [Solirubrobacterales bacterium]